MYRIIMGSSGHITGLCHARKRLVILIAEVKALEASVCLLLTQKAAERSIST